MSERLPPAETLSVTGGRGLARVDADAVQGAALLLDDVADQLRRASTRCLAARTALHRQQWEQDPAGGLFPAASTAHEDAVASAAAARLGDVAARLRHRASGADRCARRLRIAAGLYRAAESLAEHAAGAGLRWITLGLGAAVGALTVPLQVVAAGKRYVDRFGLPFGGPVADRLAPVVAPVVEPIVDPLVDRVRGTSAEEGTEAGLLGVQASTPPAPRAAEVIGGHDGTWANFWRVIAPQADDLVGGFASGYSLAVPWRWRDLERFRDGGPGALVDGVTRGAGGLADLVDAMLPASEVRVLALTDADLAGPPPAWADAPSGTVSEALARLGDLYPDGSGVVGRPAAGAPEGTLAVERVTHDDGTTTWTVLIPGTQDMLGTSNPFDAATDLQLMAHESADVSAAVEQALDDAGAADDEPVVLVGHSLGGIAATALAASPAFRAKHPVGGVVTAGSPTATFATPAGVPVLHLENDEELVSATDGRAAAGNPATADRVTVARRLLDSTDPVDLTASGSISLAHGIPTHLRTLEAVERSGNVPTAGVTRRLERLLGGARASTRLFAARRVGENGAGESGAGESTPVVLAPGTTSSGTTSPPPGVPTGATLH
ncbi:MULTISPECIES: hypothetical protein [unclassified Isoptericola]|uniref:hypothetical protein n=1 Tax=unclassified Isoptericola TaxID=2623355 RepID=UPI00364E7087